MTVRKIVLKSLQNITEGRIAVETVKHILHGLFSDEAIKVLALCNIADDPQCIRNKKVKPDDMTSREFERFAQGSYMTKIWDHAKRKENLFREEIRKNRLENAIESERLTDTERHAARELFYPPRWM